MNALLPKNPFATRFTRPEAMSFQCPVDQRAVGRDASPSDDQEVALPNSLCDASGLCRQLVQNLKSVRFGLIVGPHGSGKTTLLHTLMPYLISTFESDGISQVRQLQLTMPLESNPWSRFRHARDSAHAVADCLHGLPRGSLLVIDGVEQLRRRDLRSIVRKVGRRGVFLLATSHFRVVGISVLHQTEVDVMLIRSLAECLLDQASPAVVEVVSRELEGRDLSGLTNVRDLWFELYDIVQDHLLVDPMNLKDVRDGCSVVSSHGSQHAGDPKC